MYSEIFEPGGIKKKRNANTDPINLTWVNIKELALGEVGLCVTEFEDLEYCELVWKLTGYWRRQEREWERTRLIIAAWTGQAPKDVVHLSIDDENRIDWDEGDMQEWIAKAKIAWN